MADSMKFGPEWLRNTMSSEANSSGQGTSQSLPPKAQLSEHRYGREELLALYDEQIVLNPGPSSIAAIEPVLYSELFRTPLAFIPIAEEETFNEPNWNPPTPVYVDKRKEDWKRERSFNKSFNSSRAFPSSPSSSNTEQPGTKLYSKTSMTNQVQPSSSGSSTSQAYRGRNLFERGRGRGGPISSYNTSSRPGKEPSENYNTMNRNRYGSTMGPQSGRGWPSERNGTQDLDIRKDSLYNRNLNVSSGSVTDNAWRRDREEQEGSWRPNYNRTNSAGSSNEKWNRGSWRSQAEQSSRTDREDEKWERGKWDDSKQNFSSANNTSNNRQQRYSNSEDNLPEWATEILSESRGGSFDSNGAYHGIYSDEEGDMKDKDDDLEEEDLEKGNFRKDESNSSDNQYYSASEENSPKQHEGEQKSADEENTPYNDKSPTKALESTSPNKNSENNTPAHTPVNVHTPVKVPTPVNVPTPTRPGTVAPVFYPKTSENNQQNNIVPQQNMNEFTAPPLMRKNLGPVPDTEPHIRPDTNDFMTQRMSEVADNIDKLVNEEQHPLERMWKDDAQRMWKKMHEPSNDVLMSQWLYKDPQGAVQGPFSSVEMGEWYRSGYFRADLLVRRLCDEQFHPLGDLLHVYQNVPFLVDNSVPPIKATDHIASQTTKPIDEALMIQQFQNAQIRRVFMSQQQQLVLNVHKNLAHSMENWNNMSLLEQQAAVSQTVNRILQSNNVGAMQYNQTTPAPINIPSSNPIMQMVADLQQQQHQQQQRPQHPQQQPSIEHPPPPRGLNHSSSQHNMIHPSIPPPLGVPPSLQSHFLSEHQNHQHPHMPNHVSDLQNGSAHHNNILLDQQQNANENITSEPESTNKTVQMFLRQVMAAQQNQQQALPQMPPIPQPAQSPHLLQQVPPQMKQWREYSESELPISNSSYMVNSNSMVLPSQNQSFNPNWLEQNLPPSKVPNNSMEFKELLKTLISQTELDQKFRIPEANIFNEQDPKHTILPPTSPMVELELVEDIRNREREIEKRLMKEKEKVQHFYDDQKNNVKEIEKKKKEEEKKRKTEEQKKKKEEKDKLKKQEDDKKKKAEEEKEKKLLEEKKKKEEKRKQEQIRQEDALKKLEEQLKKDKSKTWTTSNVQSMFAPTLVDIQKNEKEQKQQTKQQKKEQTKIQKSGKQQEGNNIKKSESNFDVRLGWANSKPVPVTTKSIAEIQLEQAEQLAKQQEKEKLERAQAQLNDPGKKNTFWCASAAVPNYAQASLKSVATSYSIPSVASSYSVPASALVVNTNKKLAKNAKSVSGGSSSQSGGFWEDTSILSKSSSADASLFANNKKSNNKNNITAKSNVASSSNSNSGNNNIKCKKEEKIVKEIFTSSALKESYTNIDFINWCTTSLDSMKVSDLDIPTFIGFLEEFESPSDVKDYIKLYLGEGKQASNFANQYLDRRRSSNDTNSTNNKTDKKKSQAKSKPNTNPTENQKGATSSEFVVVQGKNKKNKKGKMRHIESSLLGFSVTAPPDRFNVGERELID